MILRHFSPTTARRAASMLLLLGAVIALLAAPAHARPGAPRPATLAASFQKAATSFSVPTDLLMAIAYINTHWQPLAGTPTEDHGYGPMHLTVQPGGDTLARAARLLNVPPELLRQDDGANIMGGAALLHDLWITCEKTKPTSDLAPWFGIVARYSNFTDPRVANSYAQDVFDIMRRGVQAVGPNGETLSIQPHPGLVTQDTKPATQNADEPLSADYGPALWAPAYSGNYEAGRSGNRINYIIIHDTEGSYQSTINWFQNPQSGVSAHYVVRSRDGEITQMVRDADTAYHAGNYPYNLQAIGIEHEGYASQNTWYTEAMYNSSAELARTLADRYGVAKDHAHIIGHYQVPYPSTHTDPGQYWRWAYYMSKVRRDWARSALVDNSDPGFTANPPAPGLGWQIFNGIGYNGSSSYMALSTTGSATNSGTWQAALPRSSTYDLYAYIPWTNNGNSETQSARYTVTTVTGTVQVVINQKALTDAGILQNGTTQGEWAHLGRYTFGTAATVTLSNSASDSGRNVWFDALMWIPINSAYPPCGGGEYEASQSSGAVIVPGTVDVGNHCDECTTTITLPFTVTLYDHPFVDAVLGSNGTIGFATNSNVFTNTCMPAAAFSYALLPYWDDLRTDGTGNGIFTSINGSAPNRIFNIEWRAGYFSGGGTAHFETRLYENQNRFDMVYDTLSQGSNTATTGIQRDTGSGNHFTQFLCNMGGLGPGMIISYTLPTCPGGGTPTPTYTRTPSATPSPTPTASACPLQVAISATCLVAGGGLRDFMFDVEGYNPSSQPITATHFIYLEVSSDGITYGFIRRTSATDVIFQPGVTTPITGTFTGMDVPPPNMYYRIRAFVIAF